MTAVVLAPFIVYVVLWAPHLVFLAVLAAVALLCFHEYSGIVSGYGIDRPGPVGYAAGLVLLLVPQDGSLALALALITLAALALSLARNDLPKGLPRAAALLLGVLYTFGLWRWAIPLRALNPHWLLFALALNWIGDVAALYAGKAFGRHKLAPRISPAKTWEGAIASFAASLVFGFFYLTRLIPSVSPIQSIALAAAGNLAGQIGDLAESAMKRGAGVKDSGAMLPGHGGWLDRVDSSLFTLPVIYWLVSLIRA
ncbi:MAG: phosphatidate cytidylyltransferase [Bryobacteraceae bacterium]